MDVDTEGVGTERMDIVDPQQELRRLDEQIRSATELAALKPIYFRLNEIIQAFPGDFDVQLAGNEIKQQVMARGALLKQQDASAHPPAAPVAPTAVVAQPPVPQMPFRDGATQGPTMTLAATVSFPLFPLFSTTPPPPEPPSPPAQFAENLVPSPVTPLESAVMTAAPAMPVSYALLDAALPEQPSLPLSVAAEVPPEPPAEPPPVALEVQPVAPSDSLPAAPATAPLEQVSPALPVAEEQTPEVLLTAPEIAPTQSDVPPASMSDAAEAASPEPAIPEFATTPIAGAAPLQEVALQPDVAAESVAHAPALPEIVEVPPPSLPAMSEDAAVPASAAPMENSAVPEAAPSPVPCDTAPLEPASLALDLVAENPHAAPEAPPPTATPAAEPTQPAWLPELAATVPAAASELHELHPATPLPAAEPKPAEAGPWSPPPSGSAPEPLPPPLDAKPAGPSQPFKMPPRRRTGFRWNRPVVIGPIAGVALALILILVLVHQARQRNAEIAARNAAAVAVSVTTSPTGALVKATPAQSGAGRAGSSCTSNCRLALTPGTYRITASLDGFEPAAGTVTVAALKPATLSMTLQPQAQSVRLLTDLGQGKVAVDDQPPVDLQEGQLVLDRMAPGTHKVKIIGKDGDASFSFEVANARLPVVTGPLTARNMIAVLVASFGKQARVLTNAGPWKLAVNGQPQSDTGPAGTDVTNFQPGVNEIVVGEGKDQRKMSESFGAAPTLTAFLKTDVNAGTLIVSSSQDGASVFLNGKEYQRRTLRGQLRIQFLGKVSVRVSKSGFQDEPAQAVDVKKGAEVRLQFDLKPQPQFGSLEIRGAIAGTEVLVDQKTAGTVAPDGLFHFGTVAPGDHTIELRREQYQPKRLQRSFHAGQAVVLSGGDAVLVAAGGTLRITRNPAAAAVKYRRGEETESHEVRGNQIDLPPGTYTFSATAPGYLESATRVQLAAGENRDLEFTLHERQAAPQPTGVSAMAEFEDAQDWTKEGDSWVHKGGGFVPFKLPPKGVFTFKVELVKGGGVFRAGQIRWFVQYIDGKNYLLSEIDRKNFRAWVVQNGQRLERVPKTPHNLGNQKTFTIQIEVAADRLVQKVRVGDDWKVIDTFAEPGRDYTKGKFGFLIQGNDEIAISDFKFQPK